MRRALLSAGGSDRRRRRADGGGRIRRHAARTLPPLGSDPAGVRDSDPTGGGASNKEIAKVLGLTEITIKSHLRNVFRKIGASNRTQAVALALREGVKAAVNPPPPGNGGGDPAMIATL